MTSLSYYPARRIMRETGAPGTLQKDLWTFKSRKSNKRYIVEVEYVSEEFLGLKFYYKGVVNSENRYSYLTNDFEPRRIVRSCVEIMLHYFRLNKRVSFGFVGAPDLVQHGAEIGNVTESGTKRFRFYRVMMLTLFGEKTFVHAWDERRSLYVMVNRERMEAGEISLRQVMDGIGELYEGEFDLFSDMP